MTSPNVVLVNEQDVSVGTMEKLEAHKKGLLHRAVSVLIFNQEGEMLLQRRAFNKYHSGGLWTNTCCSHPYPEENTLDAAHRRLEEEMGMQTELYKVFDFIYKVQLEEDLFEHELDHVYLGFSNETPHLNLEEASSFKWLDMDSIYKEIELNPQNYTEWFKLIVLEYKDQILEKLNNESLQKSYL